MKRRHSIKNTPEQQEIYDINTIVYDQEVSYKVAQTMILKINLQENQKKEEEEEEAEADVADTKLVKNNPHGEQNENNTQDDITLTSIIFIPLQEDVPQSVQRNISNNHYILYDIDNSTNTPINHEYYIQLTNNTPTKFSNESHRNNNDDYYTGSLYNHKINLQDLQKKQEEDVADTKLVKNNPHGEQNENNTQDDITLTPIIFIPLQEDVPQSVQKNISNNNYILYDIDHSTNTHINHEYCIQLTNDTPTKFSNESHLNNNDNNYTGSLYNHIWTIVPGSFSILALLLISYYLQQGIKILSLAKQTPIANTLIESTVVGTLTINTMVVRDTFYDNCIILPGEVLSNILSPIEAHTNIYDCLDCS